MRGDYDVAMQFDELDEETRAHMLAEFNSEQDGATPYRSRSLTQRGIDAFLRLMRDAIEHGDEQTLCEAMMQSEYWNPKEPYTRNGITRERNVNIAQTAERLCLTEFNTWYVRGLAARLLNEGVTHCQAYRAAVPKWEPGECSTHEGQVYMVQEIYDGHRRRYWPEPGDDAAVSIPFGAGCHHTIKRHA